MIHNPFLRAILRPPAELYGGMMRVRAELYRRGMLQVTRLPGKTISVGNLTLGGTGKTPLVIWLARQLQALAKVGQAAGYRPGILARGYGRRDENELVILRPAVKPHPSGSREDAGSLKDKIGDEAILFRRHLPDVPIGLCADRLRAASALAAECGVNLFLLDDGYQRLDVARDVNLLLVDASGRDVLIPVGRLREPASAASRADIILLTRWPDSGDSPEASRTGNLLGETLGGFTTAPVFHARTQPAGFFRVRDDQSVSDEEVRRGRWLAFCGIGNPSGFFADLRRWGLTVLHSVSFRDHHRYSSEDLVRLEKEAERLGATGIITTEKDLINMPAISRHGLQSFYYARIVMEPVEPEFWREILHRLEQSG